MEDDDKLSDSVDTKAKFTGATTEEEKEGPLPCCQKCCHCIASFTATALFIGGGKSFPSYPGLCIKSAPHSVSYACSQQQSGETILLKYFILFVCWNINCCLCRGVSTQPCHRLRLCRLLGDLSFWNFPTGRRLICSQPASEHFEKGCGGINHPR